MWPFTRTPMDLGQLSQKKADHQWQVAMRESPDGPMIIRKNLTAKQWAKHPQLSIKLGFAIPLLAPTPGGLPDPAENQQLDPIEDLIVQRFSQATTGLQVLAITNGVMKEFIFYTVEGWDIGRLHQQLQSECQSHEVQCIAERDPKWKVYFAF